jgi:hypothetical protein
MPEPAARAVVSDDGTIWLTAYGEGGVVVPVALLPVRAVALAGELIEAAVPKLGNVTEENSTKLRGRRRGGDPRADKRQQRNEDIRALARLTGNGKPLPQVAQDLITRCERYQPMPEETSPDRILLRRISDTGLPVPRKRRLIDILS